MDAKQLSDAIGNTLVRRSSNIGVTLQVGRTTQALRHVSA
jgi:hypothetical protein